MKFKTLSVLVLFLLPTITFAQSAELRNAEEAIILPGISDSNSPAHWWNGTFSVIQSMGLPLISKRMNSEGTVFKARAIHLNTQEHFPLWIEATWVDTDGTIYAWYHHEQNVCNATLAIPKIGALISTDGGDSFRDLGIIMDSPYAVDCNAKNGYFAGGHGDFSVMLDATRQHFYFYFGNYSGPQTSQGIAVARMAFADRRSPVGRVFKYFQAGWTEPGLMGRVSAIMPAAEYWTSEAADAFWGPSIHWNTYLRQYVMLMNRTCCEPGWPNEGIYVSFNPNLRNPFGWSTPQKILGGEQIGWYPQVIGSSAGMTDKLAGRVARFFLGGESHFEIVFRRTPREIEATPAPQ